MDKSLIYYSDNRIGDPIDSSVKAELLKTGLPIVSVTLKPIDFGQNIVVNVKRGPYAMLWQIFTGLAASDADTVFFCEHDVLYPKSHFDFSPARNDIFYYNEHIWRWDYPHDRMITYDRLISLSSLCVNRDLALDHYWKRITWVKKHGYDKVNGVDPAWARIMGFEPGTKKKKRGGFSDDDYETWRSPDPIIDIRHNKTYSRRKVTLSEFKHPPTNWREGTMKDTGWDLYERFSITCALKK